MIYLSESLIFFLIIPHIQVSTGRLHWKSCAFLSESACNKTVKERELEERIHTQKVLKMYTIYHHPFSS